MRLLLGLILLLTSLTGRAGSPALQLDVARFRSEDVAAKGAVLEIYATISGQQLTYLRRGTKAYQAAATLTLQVLKPDGKPAWQETVVLKPPVLQDTSMQMKNPVSFQKRIALPDGQYVLRAKVIDNYKPGSSNVVEMPLLLAAPGKGPFLSDIVLLAKAPSKTPMQSSFTRGSFNLVRAPGGLYARGTEHLYFYGEIYGLTPDQPVELRYRLRNAGHTTAKTETVVKATARGFSGRPTPIIGDLDIKMLPTGDYMLKVEVLDEQQRLLTTLTVPVQRNATEYGPAGAAPAR
ncbi:hypothetical protein LJY25_15310 [Hymenobacter sp. BT175]|uniref:hypothetical protein n=1 Tax=Hymenobacter translucens TaxID=2886507 RepID=UPI001D0E3818|nr:hypothetical protein [Hymenobacter translucens]MCC2547817.1 hypothetical protein [Hymenobacter translucens]